jgi:hypothetical protein
MGDIGTPMGLTIPAVGTSGTTYATNINLFLTEVQSRLEAEVPKSALAAGDLDMDGDDLQNVGYVGLAAQGSAPTAPVGSIQRYNNDLYWINNGGAVKITDGTTINTTLVGGITGDYGGANPAQLRFVDADQEYYAYDDYAGGAWARVWARNFDIAAGATSAFRARLAFGGGASVTYTLPAAAPVADAALQMDTTGAITASNTFANEFVAPDFKFTGSRVRWFNAGLLGQEIGGAAAHARLGDRWNLGNSTNQIVIPLYVEEEERIGEWAVRLIKTTGAGVTLRARLFKTNPSGSAAQVGTTQTTTGTATLTLSEPGLTHDVEGGSCYYVIVDASVGNPSGDAVLSAAVLVTRPS